MAARCDVCNSRRLGPARLEVVSKWASLLWWVRICRKCGSKNTEVYR